MASWDLIAKDRHLVRSHKDSQISWLADDKFLVQYHNTTNQRSSGFRTELYLKPNISYHLQITAKLTEGDLAFVYAEQGSAKLIPRIKVYPNQEFNLDQVFVVGSNQDQPVYLGLLFFHAEKNCKLEVSQFKLTELPVLSAQTLREHNFRSEETPTELEVDDELISNWMINSTVNNLTTGQESAVKSRANDQPIKKEKIELTDWDNTSQFSNISTLNLQKAQMKRSNLRDLINDYQVDQEEIQELQKVKWCQSRVTQTMIDHSLELLQERKIFISLTTIPSRANKLDQVLKSLLSQSLSPVIDKIFLVIPSKFRRNGTAYQITKKWYFKDPRIEIIKDTPDYGPLSKLFSLLYGRNKVSIRNQDLILTADDDHLYPRHWALYLTWLHLNQPKVKAIYGLKGRHLNLDKMVNSSSKTKPENVDLLKGELGVCYPRKYLGDLQKMIKQIMFSKECYNSDDLLIANHCARHQIGRVLVPLGNLIDPNKVIPYPISELSNSRDALKNLKPGLIIRTNLALGNLKTKDVCFLGKKQVSFQEQVVKECSVDSQNSDLGKTIKKETEPGIELVQINSNYFNGKKVRYISYIHNSAINAEWTLLYLSKLSNASLEIPQLADNVSLPNTYQTWLEKDPNQFECVMIDLPFIGSASFRIKIDKPVFYIYRYPTLGDPFELLQGSSAERYLVINQFDNLDRIKLRKFQNQILVWKVLPQLKLMGNPRLNWDHQKVKHYSAIIRDAFYLEGIGQLLDFWLEEFSGDQTVKLHLGVVAPYHLKLQKFLTDRGIKNINLYNQSQVFGTLIKNSDAYLSFDQSGIDLYAIWAEQNGIKVIGINTGQIGLSLEKRRTSVCPELLQNHRECQKSKGCLIYNLTQKVVGDLVMVDYGKLRNLLA